MKTIYQIIAALTLFVTAVPTTNASHRITETYPDNPTPGTSLIICGGPVLYIIDANTALTAADWRESVQWSWDARSITSQLGIAESKIDHISDCRIVDNGQKALITSTYGWCAMIECSTGKLLFYSTKTPNTHAADLLPGNIIAVVTSDGTGEYYNAIQLYRPDRPNEIIATYEFNRGHGLVWNDATERLYVAGARSLGVYRLEGHDTASPSLVLDHEVVTARSDVHDLISVNQDKLAIAGKEAYIYDIEQKSFRNIPALIGRTAFKSFNMNPDTGEMWYTDMTDTADIRLWFTHEIYWIPGRNSSSAPAATIKIPDIDVYKVRIAHWGTHQDP